MNTNANPETELTTCPICNAPAQKGCLYASDRTPMSWIAGPPSMRKNFEAAMGQGWPISRYELFSGVYAVGISCLSCQKIILEREMTS
jgi:hypothetical protein